MSIREELSSGQLGLRFSPPSSFEWRKQTPKSAVLADPDRQVLWLVRHLPWCFDLRPSRKETLRRDLEEDARFLFERAYEPREWPPGSGEIRPPRTADPSWSPVVEIEPLRLGEARALRVVRRLSYQPGDEVLSGALMVPLTTGVIEVVALARAGQTGYRESVLMLKLHPERDGAFPKQAEYDDPQHDEVFAGHPLSLVRAALRWLVTEAGIVVTRPMPLGPKGELTLDAPGCAITPPPRFVLLSSDVMPMADTLSTLVRVGLGDADVRMLDVWRYGERVTGRGRDRRLYELAAENARSWAQEGATGVEQETEIVGGDSTGVAVRNLVRFKVAGKVKVSALRWRADKDGTVFRVCASGGAATPEATVMEWAEETMASLKRVDSVDVAGSGGEKPEPDKPWWKRW